MCPKYVSSTNTNCHPVPQGPLNLCENHLEVNGVGSYMLKPVPSTDTLHTLLELSSRRFAHLICIAKHEPHLCNIQSIVEVNACLMLVQTSGNSNVVQNMTYDFKIRN